MYPFSKRIFAIATFVFEEGISTIFLFTLLAFLMRVKKSAIGSVFISLLTIDYQLAFLIPGILPESAISLNVTLESPNCLIYPLGRPVKLQRLCNLTAAEFLAIFEVLPSLQHP